MRAFPLVAASAVLIGLVAGACAQTVLDRPSSSPAAGRDAAGADPACSGFVGESWGAVPLCDRVQGAAEPPRQYPERRIAR